MVAEKNADLAGRTPSQPNFTRFSDDLPVEEGKKTVYKLQPGETFIQGLKKLDPELVSKAKSDCATPFLLLINIYVMKCLL